MSGRWEGRSLNARERHCRYTSWRRLIAAELARRHSEDWNEILEKRVHEVAQETYSDGNHPLTDNERHRARSRARSDILRQFDDEYRRQMTAYRTGVVPRPSKEIRVMTGTSRSSTDHAREYAARKSRVATEMAHAHPYDWAILLELMRWELGIERYNDRLAILGKTARSSASSRARNLLRAMYRDEYVERMNGTYVEPGEGGGDISSLDEAV